ncbi:MAG: S9 family peptidase, partial [Bacteroidetes bacterium]|nr:S9 family peptidase [Bacteroidota bacterium]
MKKSLLFLSITSALLISGCARVSVQPPVAERIPHSIEAHGDVRVDNYYWMRLTDEQKNAPEPDEQTRKVLDYLNSENEYKTAVLKHTEDLRETLFGELTGRIKKDDSTVPYLDNGYYYYTRFTEGREYPTYFRKKAEEGAAEELLLDVNQLAEGQTYCQVSGVSVSPDNKTLAYAIDLVSRRLYTIHFKDLATGQTLDEKIVNTAGYGVWAADSRTLFYVVRDPQTLRSFRVMNYELGGNGQSKVVYTEEDETFSVSVSRTQSRKYILLSSSQTLSNEVRIIDAAKPEAGFRLLEPRSENHEYRADHLNGFFYIRTNSGGATNFRLVRTPEEKTAMSNWQDVIPHRSDVLLQGWELFNNHLVVSERINGLNNLRIIQLDKDTDHYIDFGEPAYTAGININLDPSSNLFRYSYSSLTTPNSVIEYNMETREKRVLKEDEVLGGFDKNNYQSERFWAGASDGTMIPVSLVYRKGFEKNGRAPLLLYAYGSYG